MIDHIWHKYPINCRKEYEKFIKMYGSLSKLFDQKSDKDNTPYLDSKFQETIFAKSFNDCHSQIKSSDVDNGNTPHDILSVFPNGDKVGIGIKTWKDSNKFQKVAQIKSYNAKVTKLRDKYLRSKNSLERQSRASDLINCICNVKNSSLSRDYRRLDIKHPELNVYNYVVRDKNTLNIRETNYPEIDVGNIKSHYKFNYNGKKEKDGSRDLTSLSFFDGKKHYRYSFADSQFTMGFDLNKKDHCNLKSINVNILKNPFTFLKDAFNLLYTNPSQTKSLIVPSDQPEQDNAVYLPLYSPRANGNKILYPHSGLNASIGKPKASLKERKKGYHAKTPRPSYEVYIPIPSKFRKLNKHWLNPNIDLSNQPEYAHTHGGKKKISINLFWPNGQSCKASIYQQNFKALATNPQNFLGKWILQRYFGKNKFEPLTYNDMYLNGCDSVKLWHKYPGDYKDICIDMAPWDSYKHFISNEERNNQ